MFGDSFLDGRKKKGPGRRYLTFPVALVLHAAVVFSFVVIPLLQAERFPTLKECAQLVTLVPPPASAPLGRRSSPRRGPESPRPAPRRPIVLTAPPEPPEGIVPDRFDDPVDDDQGGIKDGIEIENWVGPPPTDNPAGPNHPTAPIRIASVQRPVLVKRVTPVYPAAAQSAHLSARVVVEAATDVYGRVKEVRIVSGHPLFNEAAVTAVRQWIYEPYIVCGIPKPVMFTVVVEFVLN